MAAGEIGDLGGLSPTLTLVMRSRGWAKSNNSIRRAQSNAPFELRMASTVADLEGEARNGDKIAQRPTPPRQGLGHSGRKRRVGGRGGTSQPRECPQGDSPHGQHTLFNCVRCSF